MPAGRYSSAHFLPIATSAPHWQACRVDDSHKSSHSRNDRRKKRTRTSPIASNLSSGQPSLNPSQVTIRDFAASGSPHQLHAREISSNQQSGCTLQGPVDQQSIHPSTKVIDTTNKFTATIQDIRQEAVPPQTSLDTGISFPSEDVTSVRTADSKTTTPISTFSTPPIYEDAPPATRVSPHSKSNSYITSKRQSIIQDLEFPEESIIIIQTPDVENRPNCLRLSDDAAQSNTVDGSDSNHAAASTQSLYHTFVKESSAGDHAGANPLRIILPDLEAPLLVAKTEEDTGVESNNVEYTPSQINFRQNTVSQEEDEDHASQVDNRPTGTYPIIEMSPRYPNSQAFNVTNRTFRDRCSRPRHRIQISSDADIEDNNDDPSPRHSSDYDTPTLTSGVRSLSLLSTATTHVTSPSPPPTIPSRGSSLKGVRTHSAQRTNSPSTASSTRASNSSIQQRNARQSLLSTSSSYGSASFTNSSQRRSYETTLTEPDNNEIRTSTSPVIARDSVSDTQSALASTTATQYKETKHYHSHRNTRTNNRNRNHSSIGSIYSFYYNTNRNQTHQPQATRPHQRSISASTVNYSRPSTSPGQAPALVPDLAFSPAPATIRHGRNHSSETRMEIVDDEYTFDREPSHQDPPSPYFGLDFDFGVDFNLNESSYTHSVPANNPQQQQTRPHPQNNQSAGSEPQLRSPNTPTRPETSSDLDATPPPIPITRSKPITRILNPAPWLLDPASASAPNTNGRFGSEAKVWSETRQGHPGNAQRSGLGIGVGMGAMKSGWRRVLGQVY